MDISATLSSTQSTAATTASTQGLNQMTSDDFLKVLITQLRYQDPFKPMSNEEMLSQISQIRNMEMSSTLTDSLKTLTDQQRLGSAATLIGQYVTGTVKAKDGSEKTIAGVVRGIRFEQGGKPVLDLDSGASMPLESLANVTDPNRLVGKYVEGYTFDANNNPVDVKGVVASVQYADDGQAWLQLTSGDSLPIAGVSKISAAAPGSDTTTGSTSSKDGGLTAKVVLGK
jgi:flagellar basal-body rod modification protein FlgD